MKVFLDTNVFLEYFEQRREYQAVSRLLSAVEDGKTESCRINWMRIYAELRHPHGAEKKRHS